MFRKKPFAKSLFSSIVLLSLNLSCLLVFPQDIVAADDITGGSSVFVFRKSRKDPQMKAAGRSMRRQHRSR